MTRVRQLFMVASLIFGLALAALIWAEPSISAKRDNAAMTAAAGARELAELHKRPTFDISVLDKAPHNAFPAAAKLADGTLMVIYRLALYHYNPNGPNPTSVAKAYSFDGGKTWTAPEELKMPSLNGPGATGLSVPQYGPLAGRPVAVFETTGGDGHRRTAISVANDPAGLSWGKTYTPSYNPWNTIGLPSSAAEQVNETDFVITAYANNYDTASTVVRWTGSGWTTVRYASISGVGNPDNFSEGSVALIEDKDGNTSLMAVLREETPKSGNLKINKSYSTDYGETWSKPTPAFEGYGLPYVVSLGADTVMVSYRKLHANDSSAKVGTRDAVYRISTDNGKTWGPETLYGATGRQMAYGVLVPYAANTVVGIYGKEDGHRKSAIRSSTILINLPNANQATYALSAKVGSGGSIAPANPIKVHAGDNQSFKIKPQAGFTVTSVLVNGKPAKVTNNVLSLVNIRANQDIQVSFAPNPGTKPTASPTAKPTASPTAKPTDSTVAKPTASTVATPTAAPVKPSATPVPSSAPGANKPDLTISTRITATGTKATVTALGFVPGDRIQGYIEPDIQKLGDETADQTGKVAFTFDAATLKPGEHQVILAGSQGGTGIVVFAIAKDAISKPPIPANKPAPAVPVAVKKSATPQPVIPKLEESKPSAAPTPSASPSAKPTVPVVVPVEKEKPVEFKVARGSIPRPDSRTQVTPIPAIAYGYAALVLGCWGAVTGGVMLLRRNRP